MPPPHVDISGYAAAGKSTISSLLASRHKSLWIPRITCRPKRLGEKEGTEYLFVTPIEFSARKMRGEILGAHPGAEGKLLYHTGILRPEFWPKPEPDTKLLVSVFGSRAPEVKKSEKLDMITIFLKVRDEGELEKRLTTRGVDPAYRRWRNTVYNEKQLEKQYDYVVYNDGPAEETVGEIERIAGLSDSNLMTLLQS